MTYIIKHTDNHGAWFFVRRGFWSDKATDAYHFTSKITADAEARSANVRLDKPGRPMSYRCHVIKTREPATV